MGKRKKHPETDKEKELLEKQLLGLQRAESLASIILSVISIIAAVIGMIIDLMK